MALYWDGIYEIVLALIEAYPEVDLDTLGLQRLQELVIKLPDFADEPVFANEGILAAIFQEWYEETET